MIGRLLLTGGSGFIGGNVIRRALASSWLVMNVDNRPPKQPSVGVDWRRVDLASAGELETVVRAFAPTHVLHLAARTGTAETSLERFAVNKVGFENLLRAVDQLATPPRVVITSSTLVCRIGYVPKHDTDYCPTTAYGASKVQTEQVIRGYPAKFPWTIVRPVSIWGPGQAEPYASMFAAIARGWYLHVGGDSRLKSLGYVENVAHQLLAILSARPDLVDRRTFYLADSPPTDLRVFAELIRAELGAKHIRTMPVVVARAAAKSGDLLKGIGWNSVPLTSFRLNNILTEYVYDTTPIDAIADPRPFTVPQGIARTVAWMRTGKLPEELESR